MRLSSSSSTLPVRSLSFPSLFFLLSFLLLSLLLLFSFVSTNTKYTLSTENTFPRERVAHTRKPGGSQTVKHVPRTHTHICVYIYKYICTHTVAQTCIFIYARAYFGSRSRNSVTVHHGSLADSLLSLLLPLSLSCSPRPVARDSYEAVCASPSREYFRLPTRTTATTTRRRRGTRVRPVRYLFVE